MIYISLIQNIGLLIALAYLHSLLSGRLKEKGAAVAVMSGILFGCLSIIIMMTPVQLQPGLFFDGRSIILAASGLYGGPVAALVAVAASAAFRLAMGGVGVTMGIAVIIEAACVGVVWNRLRRRGPWALQTPSLLLFGFLVHLLMIACMILLPGDTGAEVFRRLALPVLLIFPPATLLVCKLFHMMEIHEEARDELHRSNAKLKSILDNSPAVIYMKDRVGRYRFVNSRWIELFGHTIEEARGKTDPDLLPEAVARQTTENDLRVLESGQPLECHERIPARKVLRDFHSIKVPLKDDRGRVYALCGISEDITDRKQAEDALKESEARLQLYFQRLPAACIVWDREYRVQSWNPAAEKLFGYPAEAAVGRTANELIVPEHVKGEIDGVWKQLLEGNLDAHSINENVTGEGRIKLCSWTNTPHHDSQGNVCGVISVIEDITEKKQMEARLLQSQKMESIGRLAGGVAHDFNNMLSVILGYAQMALMRQQDAESSEYLNGICEAANRSIAITRQLLAFSRKEVISPKPVNLNELLMETNKTSRRLVGEDIAFIFRPASNLWRVNIDPSQMDQVVMNLLVNARDAMPDGGDIVMETENVHLDETYCERHMEAKPGEYVRLTVSDSGIGIDRGIIDHIFEPFFTTKETARGTGLGLATVYGIVTRNGGHIEVESEPGSGTTFKLHFPRISCGCLAERGVAAIEAPAGGTILLVEDDLLVRSMTQAALEELGYSVIQAETPQDAVEICSNSEVRIDVILTDVVMPGMNGREMVERIRAARSAVKVVFMSGYTADIVAERGVVEEGFSFIQKPFSIQSLNGKIAEILTSAA